MNLHFKAPLKKRKKKVKEGTLFLFTVNTDHETTTALPISFLSGCCMYKKKEKKKRYSLCFVSKNKKKNFSFVFYTQETVFQLPHLGSRGGEEASPYPFYTLYQVLTLFMGLVLIEK